MASTSAPGVSTGGSGVSTGGSGSLTSAIERFGASRGIVASSPTAGSPLVSIRSGPAGAAGDAGDCAGDDALNVIPADAV